MRDLYFVADRLEDISKELGASSFSGFLEDTKLKVKNIAADETFHIDVLHYSGSGLRVSRTLQQLQEVTFNTPYKLHVIDDQTSSIRIFEQIFPTIAFVLFDDNFMSDATLLNRIEQMSDPYKVLFIINFSSNPEEVEKFKKRLKFQIKPFVVDSEEIQGKSIDAILQSVLDKGALERLNKLGYFNSVKPIFHFLTEIFTSENKTIQTRKHLNLQSTQITKKEEMGVNFNDLMNTTRGQVQKSVSELEKMYRSKYDELNKPKVGRFSQIAEEWTQSLSDFEREELAEKTERIGITINEDYTHKFVANVAKSINDELSKDEVFIKSSIKDLLEKINHQLQAKNIPAIQYDDIDLPFPQKEKVVKSYCYIAKEFTGELIKPGFNEYFIALRDYIAVIMIAGSLLMPFQIISGVSEDHSMFGFMKPFAKGIRVATAVITLSLVIYGIYDLRKRIPRKREEEFLRELGKGKEALFNEAKRMFNDSSRDWVTNVAAWVRDVCQNISNQIDKNLRDVNQTKVSQVNTEKQQQQRLQTSIDFLQRNISSAEKMKDTLSQRFRDMVNETERDLKL
jgi:low affinity Fe/Cu permease